MSSIDFCNGYLAALVRLNSEVTDAYADFELEALPVSTDLLASLTVRYERFPVTRRKIYRDIPAESWNIQITPMGDGMEEPFRAILRKWFFHTEHMGSTPAGPGGHHRENVVIAFVDGLVAALGPFEAFYVTTTPPIWYAIDWDDIAIEANGGRYLLSLSYSD